MQLEQHELEEGFAGLPAPPRDRGTVVLVVARPELNLRELPARCTLTRDGGMDGDRWAKRPHADTGSQITLIRSDFAHLVADGQQVELCGDNLHVNLDLSDVNLPAGTRLRIGTAICEVTPKPHTGCGKFSARFGPDARAFANSELGSRLRLRGLHVRVLENGEVSPGDEITVLSRP